MRNFVCLRVTPIVVTIQVPIKKKTNERKDLEHQRLNYYILKLKIKL